RVASIMENTNLSKQQQVSEIMRQMLTQAQTAGQYFTNDQIKEMTRKVSVSLRSSRSSYFATFRHQLTILSKTDALDEEKWLNMLGTFVKDWFRYESHFVHGRDSLVDILKERGLLSESDAVQPLIGKKS